MNSEAGNTEYLSLKSLLQQWKLQHLLQHFMTQNISVDVLKMMKTQHIFELLQSFTCGDRIRFEYELEKWRYSIGSPLQQTGQMHIMPMPTTIPVPTTLSAETMANGTKRSRRDMETQTALKDAQQPKSNSTHDTFFNYNPYKSATASAGVKEPSTGNTQQASKTSIYAPRLRLPSPPVVREPHARGRPSADMLAQQMSVKLDAREILESCHPRGPELMKIYETNKRFRPVERVELINLFAHYFYEHSIHLPVKLSYELEAQILKLFPGERLKDYRTEKRGKIYIRLSNIKNNRRRAREAKAAFLKDVDKADGNDDDTNPVSNDEPNDLLFAEDTEMMEEDNSDSSEKPLTIYVSEIKQETEDDEFLD